MAIQAKNINRILAAPIRISNFSANGSSGSITSAITTALSTAGKGGVSVPLQVSNLEGVGIVATAPTNRTRILTNGSEDAITDGSGEVVYGRITESSGVYTLSYFTLSNAGVENVYSFGSATAIDFTFNYRFDFHRLPTDALVSMLVRSLTQTSGSSSAPAAYAELLSITAQNTVANLTKTPVSTSTIQFIFNETNYDTFGGADAPFSVNLGTKAVTYNPASTRTGVSLDTTDRLVARYFTLE